MTDRKLFQLRLKTEKLGRGSPLRVCRYRSFFLATNMRLARGKTQQSGQLNDKKETGPPFPNAAGSQGWVTSGPSGEVLQKISKILLAFWSPLEIIPGCLHTGH
jgi:hypothetical protein